MILHIDMDAFYAAIEQRDNPELQGQPVVVGGSSGRGVVTAASYEARRFGIHSAMPGKRAAQLCPDAVFIRGNISHYAEVGRQVREIFHRYTPIVQPLSLDEAFLDISGCLRLHGSARTIGWAIKNAIRDELNLTASVGVAPLKFVAKIASDLQKPDGFVEVTAGNVLAFLEPLAISRLWGVGRVGQNRLHQLGIRTVGDLRKLDQLLVREKFGSWGLHLWRLAHGIDERKVVPDQSAKQISHERTFAEDITDQELLLAVVSHLCEQVARRLRRHERQAKTITIKYRRDDFRTFSRSKTIPNMTNRTDKLFECCKGLLREMRESQPRPVRLIGVSVSSLSHEHSAQQMMLFDDGPKESAAKQVDGVVDSLVDQLGGQAIYRATSHRWVKYKRD